MACLLTRRGGRGLGAEARASGRSQGEDWGWRCEHSLKGASAPRLAGRESGKKSAAAKEAREFFLPLCFLVHKERGFRAPPKRAPETGASCGYQHRSHSNRGAEENMERFLHRGSVPSSTQQPKRLVCSPAGAGGGWEPRLTLWSDRRERTGVGGMNTA